MNNRSRVGLIMGIIGPELSELHVFALELEKMQNLTVYTLAFTNSTKLGGNACD